MQPWVSNDVWRQLDPVAGRLSRRSVRRLRIVVVVLIVLAVLAALSWRSGAVAPRLKWTDEWGWEASVGPELVSHAVVVVNDGWLPAQILGVGRSGPGLELVSVREGTSVDFREGSGIFPYVLQPGAIVAFAVVYRITDCSAIPQDPWPVPVRVQRPWGVQTVYIGLPEESFRAPQLLSYSGRNPYAVEWQRWIAADLCDY